MAALAVVALGAVAAEGSAARTKVHTVELDGDAAPERVAVKRARCREAYPCTQLVLRDGRRRVKLTPISQRPRHPYHWAVARVRFHDLTGDGRPEIMWDIRTVGGTVSSPSLTGVHQWDGRRASRIFAFSNGRKAPPGYSYVVSARAEIVGGAAGALPEIETRESLHGPDDANCCPSAYRITGHRWDGRRIAPVPGSERIE